MRSTWKALVAVVFILVCTGFGAAVAQEKATPAKAPNAAHKVELPAAVKTAFESAYPKATIKNVSTEKHAGALCYEVESMDGTQARDLVYHADGTVVEMEEAITQADLPQPVQQAIAAKYPKGKILKAERLTRGATLLYEVRVDDGGKTHEVRFNPTGALVKSGHGTSTKFRTKSAPRMGE